MRQIMGMKVVHIIAFFCLAYVGVEVTIGGTIVFFFSFALTHTANSSEGWIVTFAIEERGGGSSAGYLTSGFFGGRISRWILLGAPSQKG